METLLTAADYKTADGLQTTTNGEIEIRDEVWEAVCVVS